MTDDPYRDKNFRDRVRLYFLQILDSYYFPFATGKAGIKEGRATGEDLMNRNSDEYRRKMESVVDNDLDRFITLTLKFRFNEFPQLGGQFRREFLRRIKLQWPEDLYQEFSKFVANNDQIRTEYHRQIEEAHRHLVPDGERKSGPEPVEHGSCPYCEGNLVLMIAVLNLQSGEERKCAYRCVCEPAALKYGGLPAAERPMLEHAKVENGRKADESREYLKRIGVDPDKPLTFGDFFRQLKRFLSSTTQGTISTRQNRTKTGLDSTLDHEKVNLPQNDRECSRNDFSPVSDDEASALAIYNEQIPGEAAWGDDTEGNLIF